jgi:hypothetical protein
MGCLDSDDARIIDHLSQALEAAQEDLGSIGGTLGAGARDLRKDVHGLLPDASRHLKKRGMRVRSALEAAHPDRIGSSLYKSDHVASAWDEIDLAAELGEPFEHLRSIDLERCRASAEERYDVSATVAGYEPVYRRAIAGDRRRHSSLAAAPARQRVRYPRAPRSTT